MVPKLHCDSGVQIPVCGKSMLTYVRLCICAQSRLAFRGRQGYVPGDTFSHAQMRELLLQCQVSVVPSLPARQASFDGPSHFIEALEHDETKSTARVLDSGRDAKGHYSVHIFRHEIASSALTGSKRLSCPLGIAQKQDSEALGCLLRRLFITEDPECDRELQRAFFINC